MRKGPRQRPLYAQGRPGRTSEHSGLAVPSRPLDGPAWSIRAIMTDSSGMSSPAGAILGGNRHVPERTILSDLRF